MTSKLIGDTNNEASIITDWSEIDWKVVNREFKRLRRRIFQAKVDNNLRKLRSLQRLMLKSSSNILYSIKQISNNAGRKTKGVDNFIIKGPSDKLFLFNEIRKNKYYGMDPKPTRRIFIQEPGKKRPISIPTIYDRVIQTMTKNALEPEWEAIFEKGSYGFRPKRNVNDAVSRLWSALNKPGSRKWIVDSDISKCFDSISHHYILDKLNYFPAKNLIRKWLNTGVIINGIWFESGDEGTPQGSAISPLLCNIALHGLESELGIKYVPSTGYVNSKSRLLIRFADDLVILCKTKEDAIFALEQLSQALMKRGLEISLSKTKIVHITEGFDFLGYNICLKPKPYVSFSRCFPQNQENDDPRINQKLMGVYVAPSKKSIDKVKTKLKDTANKCTSKMTKILIIRMNAIIRGYAQSKWYWHSSKTFSYLNNYVYNLLWRWIKRRHPGKMKHWLKNKYFTSLNIARVKEKHVFYSKNNKATDRYDETYLFRFHWFRIKDYYMAKMDRLPDNKKDIEYYKDLEYERNARRPFNVFFKLDKDLAESQNYICPICNEMLFNEEEDTHIHHINPKCYGGKHTFKNLVLIHNSCHKEVHDEKKREYYKEFLSNFKRLHNRISRK